MKLVTFISTIFLVKLSLVNPLLVRRHFHEGLLYDDFSADAENVRFTITGGQGWNNLDTLAQENALQDKAMFCTRGPGAWLLYPDSDYKLNSQQVLKLIYNEHCVPADDVNSLQPLGPIYFNAIDRSFAVAFTESYFRSLGVSAQDAPKPIKSIIITGDSDWLVDTGKNKVCLTTSIADDGDICLVEDVETSLGISGDQVTITKGCGKEEDVQTYGLQTCYGTGYRELIYDFDFSVKEMQGICSASDGLGDAENEANALQHKLLNVVRIWERRLNTKSDYGFPDGVPSVRERLAILWHMINIVDQNCPSVDGEYLEIIKQIYLLHIKNGRIWNATEAPDGTKFEQDENKWIRAQNFITDCSKLVDPVITPGCGLQDVSVMNNAMEEAAIEDFLLGEEYDFAIEQIWLILNFVSPFCNNVMQFNDNYWSIFPLLFKRDFLYPLREQWRKPGRWSKYYPLMFNGFDMESERKELISCVQGIILKTPLLDPLARPQGFFSANETELNQLTSATGPKPSAPSPPAPAEPETESPPAEKEEKRRKRQRYFESESEEVISPLSRSFSGKSIPSAMMSTTSTTEIPDTTIQPVQGGRDALEASANQGKKKRKGRKGHKKRKTGGKRQSTKYVNPPQSGPSV